MTSQKSNSSTRPIIAIEIGLDDRLLDFAFSDNGSGDPERILIEMEEAGDLIIRVSEDTQGNKTITLEYEE